MTEIQKFIAIFMATIVLVASFAFIYPMPPVFAGGQRRTYDKEGNITYSELHTQSAMEKIVHKATRLAKRGYSNFNSLKAEIESYLSDGANWTEARITALYDAIDELADEMYNDALNNGSGVISTIMQKVGYYVKDLQYFYNTLLANPLDLIDICANMESENGVYTFDTDIFNAVWEVSQETSTDYDSTYFYIFSTSTPAQYIDWLGTHIYNDMKAATETFFAGHEMADDEILIFKYKPSNAYFQAYQTFDYMYVYGNTTSSQSGWGFFIRNVNARTMEAYLPGMVWQENLQECQIYCNRPISSSTPSEQHSFSDMIEIYISKDARDMKLFKSADLYRQWYDVGNGNRGYYKSDTYNTWNTNEDHSMSVSGDYVENADIENDYSTIENNITTNNDYSDNSVTTIINNYYGSNEVPVYVPSENGGGSSEGGNGILAFLDGLRTLLNAIMELIGGILGIIGDLLSGFIATLTSFTQFGDDFGEFLGAQFTFLPSDAVAVIVAGISAMVVIGVIKFIKG